MNPKEKILIIEDNESIRENIRDILEYEEYEVAAAENGIAGLEMASTLRPDLILCDINMPGKDGYQVLAELRNDPGLNTTPFIFLTAHDEKSEVRKGMELGADDYLAKPFRAAELIGAVETRLEKLRKREEVSRREWDQFSDEISSMIPHELKTPLNSICTLTELLRDHWQELEAAEIQEYLDLMSESGDRLRHVAENLSLYSRLRSLRESSSEESPSNSDPEDLHLYLLPLANSVATHHHRSDDLKLNLPRGIATSQHCGLIGKAFCELIDNAFKFSKAGNHVTVTLSRENEESLIEIVDQGEGMTPEQIRKVGAMVQFGRKKKEQQGIGLGLALAREICEHLDGTLTIHQNDDAGVSTTLRIP